MGPEEKKLLVIYLDGIPIEVKGAPTLTIIDADPYLGLDYKPVKIQLEVKIFRCRTRKRFIKLMAGTFGVQRNEAAALAQFGMASGYASYRALWADCLMGLWKPADNPEMGSEYTGKE